jgi:hypothetical protein
MSKPDKSQRDASQPATTKLKKWRRPPKFGGRPETLRRVEIIRCNLDKTDAAIGRIYGVTRGAVHALRVRFGIPKRRGNTQVQERFIAMLRALPPKLPPEVMAQKLGLPEAKARHYAHLAGYRFETKVEKANRLRKEQIKALPPGLTLVMVAKRLGVSYGYGLDLCQKYRYKVRWHRSSKPARVPFEHTRKLNS